MLHKFVFHLDKSFRGTRRATIANLRWFEYQNLARFLEINISTRKIFRKDWDCCKLLSSSICSSNLYAHSFRYLFFFLKNYLPVQNVIIPRYPTKDRVVIVVNQDVWIRGALNIHKYKAQNTGLDLESSQVQLGSTIQLASWNSVLDVTRRYTIQIGNSDPSVREKGWRKRFDYYEISSSLHSDSRPRIRTGGEERDKKIVVLIYRYVQISIRDNFIRRKW